MPVSPLHLFLLFTLHLHSRMPYTVFVVAIPFLLLHITDFILSRRNSPVSGFHFSNAYAEIEMPFF